MLLRFVALVFIIGVRFEMVLRYFGIYRLSMVPELTAATPYWLAYQISSFPSPQSVPNAVVILEAWLRRSSHISSYMLITSSGPWLHHSVAQLALSSSFSPSPTTVIRSVTHSLSRSHLPLPCSVSRSNASRCSPLTLNIVGSLVISHTIRSWFRLYMTSESCRRTNPSFNIKSTNAEHAFGLVCPLSGGM